MYLNLVRTEYAKYHYKEMAWLPFQKVITFQYSRRLVQKYAKNVLVGQTVPAKVVNVTSGQNYLQTTILIGSFNSEK